MLGASFLFSICKAFLAHTAKFQPNIRKLITYTRQAPPQQAGQPGSCTRQMPTCIPALKAACRRTALLQQQSTTAASTCFGRGSGSECTCRWAQQRSGYSAQGSPSHRAPIALHTAHEHTLPGSRLPPCTARGSALLHSPCHHMPTCRQLTRIPSDSD